MTSPIPTPAPSVPSSTANRDVLLKDIHTKWDKFSTDDVSKLTGIDDLVVKISSAYGKDKAAVRIDVDALLKGRTF